MILNGVQSRFSRKRSRRMRPYLYFCRRRAFKEHVRVGEKRVLISPSFYKDRMKEAKKLVYELRKSN
jgi:hypothetical protein